VKFLVDVNLPPRLCVWLRSRQHEAEHLFDRNLLTATDTAIWELGRVENLIILSKDIDFMTVRCCTDLRRRSSTLEWETVATAAFLSILPHTGMTSNNRSSPDAGLSR
jgi:predicted nuclease of predicted toxin-antitoxin system